MKQHKMRISTALTMWLLLCVSTVVGFLGFGGGYAFGGASSVYSLEPFKYIDLIPGGLATHGILMCAMALGLLWGIAGIVQSHGFAASSWNAARVSLVAITFYSAWCTYAFAAAWVSNHHYVSITWFFLATLISAGTLLASTRMVRNTSAAQTISALEAAAKASLRDGSNASPIRSL
jgi:hypothetical protein